MARSSKEAEQESMSGMTKKRPVTMYLIADEEDEKQINLLEEYWRIIKNHRKLIIVITVLCTVVAAIPAFFLDEIYCAEVLLSPVMSDDGQNELTGLTPGFSGLAALAGLARPDNNRKDEALATLKSRAFTTEFIREENLLPVLFHQKWDGEAGQWKEEYRIDHPTIWDAYELFDRKVRSIAEDRRNGLVTLSIEWKDRVKAAGWANQLVAKVNQNIRHKVINEAERSIDYLNKELTKTRIVELQKAIYLLIEKQLNKRMLANIRNEYAFRIIDPAAIPDEDEFVRPKRILILLAGVIVGMIAGFMAAFVLDAARNVKAQPSCDSRQGIRT